MTEDEAFQNNSTVNYQALVPSLTILGLLVLVTAIGAVIIMVRAHRIRKSRNEQSYEEDAGCFLFFCRRRAKHADVEESKPSKSKFSRITAEKALGPFPWKDVKATNEKAPSRGVERSTPSGAIEVESGGSRDTQGRAAGGVVPAVPAASNAENRGPREGNSLEMKEVGEGSLRKLEHLTGSKVVPPIETNNSGRDRDSTNIIHSAKSNATTYTGSSEQWSSDFTPRYPSLGDIITPLTAPPANPKRAYSHVTALSQTSPKLTGAKPKRVSFTYDNRVPHHIATQHSSNRQSRQSFPQRRVFNHSLPPLPPASPTPLVEYGGYNEPKLPPPVKRRPPPPPPTIVTKSEISSKDVSGISKAERSHRRSWSGRSVLELDESTTPDSEQGQYPPSPDSYYSQNPPPPPPHDRAGVFSRSSDHSSLPLAEAASRPRLPLQELSRLAGSPHIRTPQIETAPRVESMMGETIHIPVPLPPTALSAGSSSSTISSYRRAVLGTAPNSPRASSDGAGVMMEGDSEGQFTKLNRYSAGGQSVADTVLTEDTVGTLGTVTTEKELALEMENIRERAKRASVERKARRAEEERTEGEKDRKGKGADRGHGSGQ